MKIELVITVWEGGLFRMIDRIEANDTDSLKTQFALSVMNIEERLSIAKNQALEDDDIPF